MSELCSCGYPDCAVCACTKAERERDELRGQVVRLEAERDEARALLRGCHHAILAACYSEDGCDQSEGEPLLQKLWALFPDLWEAVERDYQP